MYFSLTFDFGVKYNPHIFLTEFVRFIQLHHNEAKINLQTIAQIEMYSQVCSLEV